MPRIMFTSQMMLSQSKANFAFRRSSSNWGSQKYSTTSSSTASSSTASSSSNSSNPGSVDLSRSMHLDRRGSLLKEELALTTRQPVVVQDLSERSSNDDGAATDDWGHFVDIKPWEEDTELNRSFLNGFDASHRSSNAKLKPIVDSGY